MPRKILSIPSPEQRTLVRESRTTRVERFEDPTGAYFLKTYRYDGLRAALRGAFRNTFLAPSRVARELRALELLAAAGVQPDLEAEIREERRGGWLVLGQILTRDFGGRDLERRLREVEGSAGLTPANWADLGRFVRALKATGLRDPDLKARNVLVREAENGRTEFAKIDASSSRVGRPEPLEALARSRDIRTFVADLETLGATTACIRAFLDGLADRDPGSE